MCFVTHSPCPRGLARVPELFPHHETLSGKPLEQGLFEDGSRLAPRGPAYGWWEPLRHPCLCESALRLCCCPLPLNAVPQHGWALASGLSIFQLSQMPVRWAVPWSPHTRPRSGGGVRHLSSSPSWKRQGQGVDVEHNDRFSREVLPLSTFQFQPCRTLEIGDRLGTGKWVSGYLLWKYCGGTRVLLFYCQPMGRTIR